MEQPKRKPLRLPDYDYGSNGVYFVTVCTHHRARLFWDSDVPALNGRGTMIHTWLKCIPERFSGVFLDTYAIMPNHVHMMLYFQQTEHSLEHVLDWFKTMTTNAYIRMVKDGAAPPFEGKIWQRSYYDHVIRNETDLSETRRYVQENPLKWHLDALYR